MNPPIPTRADTNRHGASLQIIVIFVFTRFGPGAPCLARGLPHKIPLTRSGAESSRAGQQSFRPVPADINSLRYCSVHRLP